MKLNKVIKYNLVVNDEYFYPLGTSKANREKVLDSLNAEYGFLINKDLNITNAYEKMVETRPRKLLSKHDYNNNGVPFRSARCTEDPKETDVNKIGYTFHKTYIIIL